MKIGEIIEIEGEKYIAQEEVLVCKYCHFVNRVDIDCYKEYGCKSQDQVIFVKIPIELIGKSTTLENFSGLLGKQYLFLQDDNTYYNRYTDEYMTAEDAEHWLYSELSSLINRR
jgi:hypothetical protein